MSLVDSAVVVEACDEMPSGLLVQTVARALSHLIDESPVQKEALHVFDSSRIPRISVEDYLERLLMTFECCNTSFIGAVVLLDRLLLNRRLQGREPQRLTAWNIHRLFCTCLVTSVKYNEDFVCGISHYAKAGGVQAKELASMERFLLTALDFDLRARPEQFWSYVCAFRALGAVRSVVPKAARRSLARRPSLASCSASLVPRDESARVAVDSAAPRKLLGSGTTSSLLDKGLLRWLPRVCVQFCSSVSQEIACSLSASLRAENP